jgi:hypothetical protein
VSAVGAPSGGEGMIPSVMSLRYGALAALLAAIYFIVA